MKGHPVHIRDVRALSAEKVWKMRGMYRVTFDDGVELQLASRQIKLSWPYWALSRLYPSVSTPSSMCYQHGEVATDDKHIGFMSKASVLAREAGVELPDTRYILSQHIYADAFNLTVKHLLPYCTTIDVDTMMEIYAHPDYKIVLDWTVQYPTGYDDEGVDMVEKAYQIIESIIANDERLKYNPLVMSVKDGTVKINQILQAYVRGKTSEIDSRVYTNQVWEGFFNGLHDLASRIKEAGATSRSHLYNTDNIAEAEYGSRKLQLAANVLMTFYYGDCGTTHHHCHTFQNTDVSKDSFMAMEGMRYRLENDTTGPWRRFEKADYEGLIGKPLVFRSAMTCRHMAKQGVCAVCMGDLIYNLSEETAPGHLASTSISEKGSQGILSTKHLDFLRKLLRLAIHGAQRDFLCNYDRQSQKGLALLPKPLRGTWDDYRLVLTDKLHSEISQIAYHESLDDVDETALPEINDLTFQQLDKDGEVVDEIPVDVRMGVCGNFSKAFLQFFLRNRETLVHDKKFVYLPLKAWNSKHPILTYTNRSESMAEFVAGLETKLRSIAADKNEDANEIINVNSNVKMNKRQGKVKTLTLVEMGGSTEKQCTYAMFDTFRYINRKLKGVPMTHVAIMLAISRVESPTNSFPAVGFDSEEANEFNGKRFVDHNTLIGIRSGAPMLLFQGQQDNLNAVGFWVGRHRPASLYDGAFPTVPK